VRNDLAAANGLLERFEPLFSPRAIAVAGVSAKSVGQGNAFIRNLREAGYQGAIYPIHPSERTLEGLPAFSSLAGTPTPVDYAFVAIGAAGVPALLRSGQGRVRFAQVMSSGFAHDVNGRNLAHELIDAVRTGGMRLLGPNCMGTCSPRGRMNFIGGGVDAPGSIGVMSQSGGLSIDILRHGRYRGLRFSGVVSLGNCLDLGPNDLLEYFIADPHTKVIGAYLENVPDGRRFFEHLHSAQAAKPVVILKGGRSAQGQRAAASHTGSLASDDQVWRAMARQTGAVMADTFEHFIDMLAAFQSNQPLVRPSGRVILFGNGGGASVLAADCMAQLGLEVPPLQHETIAALERLGVPPGASLDNPIDVPANILQRERGALAQRILSTIALHESPEAIVVHLNLPVILGYRHIDMLADLMQATTRLRLQMASRSHLLLVLRSTGEPEFEERRSDCTRMAMREGIPVFGQLSDAARALAALHGHARFVDDRQTSREKKTRSCPSYHTIDT
jgi:acyl-CoA synthetase (NDP forming)